jgi:hypothetical protein
LEKQNEICSASLGEKMKYEELADFASYFKYDKKIIEEYINNFKSVKELSFLDGLEDNRLIMKLSSKEKESLDKGFQILKEKEPDINISYEEFQSNKIVINGQTRKLFKYIHDQKLSEEIGKYKLPDKELYIVVSNNFNDMVLASTENSSWTSCIDIKNDGDFRLTVLSNIFTEGRFIIYITDLSEKNFNNIKSYNAFFRSFGFVEESGKLVSSLLYPDRINFSFKNDKIKIEEIKETAVSKYKIDIIPNNDKIFIFPYFDNGCVFKKDNDFYYSCSEKNTGYKPSVLNTDTKNIFDYDKIFSITKGDENSCLKKRCDECGKKSPFIITFNGKNYCHECYKTHKEKCQFCGKETKCQMTTEGLIICADCIERKHMKVCMRCGSVFKKSRFKSCEYCRSGKYDPFRKIDYFNPKKNNFYLYEKHQLFSSDGEERFNDIYWDDEKGDYVLK